MAMELSKNPTVLVINDTVFAHGGLLPVHGEWRARMVRCVHAACLAVPMTSRRLRGLHLGVLACALNQPYVLTVWCCSCQLISSRMPSCMTAHYPSTHFISCAVAYGLERLNAEVSAWMRADKTTEGGNSAPPFLAMGCVLGHSCRV